ncbi:TSC22 domain family protein 2 isoform X2 [Mugil cephalus]|uniref:TSC22 domain family protein 2 isoform X2 n=1 Tax=Mugil cephalus TaxID=48193 RepID=UPI001FB7E1D2|nr:TSC22 domain family protein 2 isoform X2 [Mugil cephalus]
MSKMPAKKKSCFQITSVTQAQVAANNIPDDTESLEDPDESRTEDMSSEIFDVSRADLGLCDRSSSDEETLNNGDESSEVQPHMDPVNGGLPYKGTGSDCVTPHNAGGRVSVPATAHSFVPSPTSNAVPTAIVSSNVAYTAPVGTSCSSRFRVIKLDHGTGEPFRRGRWTCTEFYDKDSDSNVSRTVDSIKPTSSIDRSLDRDSGLGATSNCLISSSTFSAQALENMDSGYPVDSGHPSHSYPSESLQQGYNLSPQIGSGASAFKPTGYTTLSSQLPQAQVNMQPVAPQTFLSNSLNGVHQGAMQQKSPIIPPTTQAQPFAYSTHPDYQLHFGSNTQNLPMTSLAAGPPAYQVPLPLPPAGPGAQGLSGEAAMAFLPGSGQQQPVSETQPSGGLDIAPAPSVTNATSHSGGQNVPATVPSSTNHPPAVPGQLLGTGGHVQFQGAHGGTATGFSLDFVKTDDSRQKTDALPQHTVRILPGKDGVKPLIGEGLNLPTPTVNSLFGISITMDVDDDRQPTKCWTGICLFRHLQPPPSSFHSAIESITLWAS